MSLDETLEEEETGEDEEGGKKGGGLVVTLAIVGVLSLVAAGGGWFLGGMLSGSFLTDEKKEEIAEKAAAEAILAAANAGGGGHGGGGAEGEDPAPHIATEENGVVTLEPITANLAYPSDNWVRLEVALMFEGAPELPLAEVIHQDIAAYLRTLSLRQVQGTRAFQYLREDLKERIDVRAQGKVKELMVRTFVIE